MKREILFRGKRVDNGEWVEGGFTFDAAKTTRITEVDKSFTGLTFYKVIPETICQFTGLTDKNGKKIFEGDRFLFWACYPTTQTHPGDNIPQGSYTEPDETQFLKLEAVVVWDEDSAKFTFSLLSKIPYQFSQYSNFGWYDYEGLLPIIERSAYSLDYIKEYYGYEGISNNEWQEFLSDVGFVSEQEMMNEVNKIEIIGNIHDNPELLTN